MTATGSSRTTPADITAAALASFEAARIRACAS